MKKVTFQISTITAILVMVILPGLMFAQQHRIMPLGNSITHGEHGSTPLGGYRDDLANMLLTDGISFTMVGTQSDGVNLYPYHEGHPGWSTDEISKKINEYLRLTNPEIILLHIGTNDINPSPDSKDATYVKKATDELLTEIYRYDATLTVFVASIFPRKGDLNAEHTQLAPLLKALVAQRKEAGYSVFYCPVNELVNAHSNPERYLYDYLHPNNDGYNLIAQGFFKRLMDYLSAENGMITDNFNRHQLTEYWYSKGEYELDNYRIRNATANSERYIAVYGYEDDPKAVSVTFGMDIDPNGNGEAGLAVRLSDGTDRPDGYAIVRESASGDLVLFHVTRGQLAEELDRVPGLNPTPVENDTFKVALISNPGSHLFDCYVNSRFDGRLIDPNQLEGRYGHQHAGVILTGSENNLLDNFTFSYIEHQPYNGPGGMEIVQGGTQEGVVNSVAAEELVVRIRDINSALLAGIPVLYDVAEGSGVIWQSTTTGLHSYEAECSELSAPIMKEESVETAGKHYIVLPSSAAPYQGKAELQVEIVQTGNYRIWGRVKGNDSNGRSFGVKVDTGTESVWQFTGDSWHWASIGQFNLSSGRHKITFEGRETGAFLDRLILTTNTGFTPEATITGSSQFATNSSGQATAKVILPKKIGNLKVQAYAVDYPSLSQSFALTANADVPAIMTKRTGDNQVGKPNEQLPLPFTVQITDQYGNYSINTGVQFNITQGNGTMLEPQPVKTDAQGMAKAHFMFGSDAGENKAQVICPNYISNGVTFTAIAEKILFAIRGQITYYANLEPVPDVLLTANGEMTAEEMTNSSGQYEFSAIPKNTDFDITPSKLMDAANARATIDLYNAALVVRHALGIQTLNANQQIAADVDQNGIVSSYDAANIARFVVQLPPATSSIKVANWVFWQQNRSYSNITVDLNNQNFTGFLLGDVNGQWRTDASLLAKETGASYAWPAALQGMVGDTIAIPFVVDQIDILSCDLHYLFNPADVEFVDIQKTKISETFSIFHNIVENRLQIGMFSPYFTEETGELLNVRFRLLQDAASEASITFEKYRINDQPFVVLSSAVPLSTGSEIPKTFALLQNYPNPFSAGGTFAATMIEYLLPQTGFVEISIYNLLGQEIKRLVAKEVSAGKHQVSWDGTDWNGIETASGIYVYRLKTDNKVITRRMLKIR